MVSCECFLSVAAGNCDSQNAMLGTTITLEIEVRKLLYCWIKYGRNGYILKLLEMD